MARKHLNFINIIPLFSENLDLAVSEIHRQHKELGINKFALSLVLQPEGKDAYANADFIISKGRYVMERVHEPGIQVGRIFQCTM